MKKFFAAILLFFAVAIAQCAEPNEQWFCKILAIADIQYADIPQSIGRDYRGSLKKLVEVRKNENGRKYDFMLCLGDFIDREFKSFAPVIGSLNEFRLPLKNVLGNHDLNCNKEEQNKVLKLLFEDGKSAYHFDVGKWRFVALDPMRLSAVSKLKTPEQETEFSEMYSALLKEKAPNAKPWNGGIDAAQIEWLKKILNDADSKGLNVAILCHMQIWPVSGESLYNAKEIADIFSAHKCVKICISGHKHSGDYASKDGVHYFTLAGMVEGDSISYARISLSKDSAAIEGFGKAISMEMKLRD